jgi:hypothetical protein
MNIIFEHTRKMLSAQTKWGDYLLEEETSRDRQYIELSEEEWKTVVRQQIKACKTDVRHVLNWAVSVERKRHEWLPSHMVITEAGDPNDASLRLFRDMVNEPEKYGDDITEVLELEEELMRGPKRWRVGAFWLEKEDQQKIAEAERRVADAATTIESAIRGHLARNKMKFRDCYLCLSHRICRKNVILGVYTCPGCRQVPDDDCNSLPEYDGDAGPFDYGTDMDSDSYCSDDLNEDNDYDY